MTESASAFLVLVRCFLSAGVAPERRSKADATDWLGKKRRAPLGGFCPPEGFPRAATPTVQREKLPWPPTQIQGPHFFGEVPSGGLGLYTRRRRAAFARLPY